MDSIVPVLPFQPPVAVTTGQPCVACSKLGYLCPAHRVRAPGAIWGPGFDFTEQEMAEALEAANGLTATAAEFLGCSQSTVHAAMKRHPSLMELHQIKRDIVIDRAEDKLFEAIQEGEAWAVKYALSTIGKRRGFTERTELTGADGGAIRTEHTVPLDSLSIETKRKIVAELIQGDYNDDNKDPQLQSPRLITGGNKAAK